MPITFPSSKTIKKIKNQQQGEGASFRVYIARLSDSNGSNEELDLYGLLSAIKNS